VRWEEKSLTLRGLATRAPGLSGHLLVYVPAGFTPLDDPGQFDAPVLTVPVHFEGEEQRWSVSFRR
jgi:hypothetical protein